MRIGIYDPYFDTLGGGEKYVLDIAAALSKNNDIFIFWDPRLEGELKEKIRGRFNLDISSFQFTKNIFSPHVSLAARLLTSSKFDLIIFISDGSIPLLLSKKAIAVFQFPVNWIKGKSLLTKMKLSKLNTVVCYSQFVKSYIDKTFETDSIVLSPAVDGLLNKKIKKENMVLSVGRFTRDMNAKKQDVLIDAFRKMYKYNGFWKLIIVGSVLPADEDFVKELENKAKGLPVEIYKNVSYGELSTLYQKSKIYWHAAGYGEDLNAHPERAEHFGISTVEAMSAGSVPVVMNAGGQKEIVEHKKSGFLWKETSELIKYTQILMNDVPVFKKMSVNATRRFEKFSRNEFNKKIESLLK